MGLTWLIEDVTHHLAFPVYSKEEAGGGDLACKVRD